MAKNKMAARMTGIVIGLFIFQCLALLALKTDIGLWILKGILIILIVLPVVLCVRYQRVGRQNLMRQNPFIQGGGWYHKTAKTEDKDDLDQQLS